MTQNATRTGGRILVDQLVIQGCDRIFSVPGESFLAVLDALPDHLPMAIEERSVALRDNFPDLIERARECARTSRAWLDSRGLDARG